MVTRATIGGDLAVLMKRGRVALDDCSALLDLPLVKAVEHGPTSGPSVVLELLESALEQATKEDNNYVQACAAICRIGPTYRPGQGIKEARDLAGKFIPGNIGDAGIRAGDHQELARLAYEKAIIRYIKRTSNNYNLAVEFLERCLVSPGRAANIARNIVANSVSPVELQPSIGVSLGFAAELEQALSATKAVLKAFNWYHYRSYLLKAIVQLPSRRLDECLEEARDAPGLARALHEWLPSLTVPIDRREPYRPFRWEEDFKEVVHAQKLAQADRSPNVNEYHVMLGLIEVPSRGTQRKLGEFLIDNDSSLDRLRDRVRSALHAPGFPSPVSP